jgi:hypothetical protein
MKKCSGSDGFPKSLPMVLWRASQKRRDSHVTSTRSLSCCQQILWSTLTSDLLQCFVLLFHPSPIDELLQARVTCCRSEKILGLSPISCPKPASTISSHHHHHHHFGLHYVSLSAACLASPEYITLPLHHIAFERTTSDSSFFYYPSKQPSQNVAQYELEEAQGDRYRVW